MPNILESHGEAVKTIHRLHEENEALRGAQCIARRCGTSRRRMQPLRWPIEWRG